MSPRIREQAGCEYRSRRELTLPHSFIPPSYHSYYYWFNHAKRHCSLGLVSRVINLHIRIREYIVEKSIVVLDSIVGIQFLYTVCAYDPFWHICKFIARGSWLRDEILVYAWLSVIQGPRDTQSLFAWQALALVTLCDRLVCLIAEQPLYTHKHTRVCRAYTVDAQDVAEFLLFPS